MAAMFPWSSLAALLLATLLASSAARPQFADVLGSLATDASSASPSSASPSSAAFPSSAASPASASSPASSQGPGLAVLKIPNLPTSTSSTSPPVFPNMPNIPAPSTPAVPSTPAMPNMPSIPSIPNHFLPSISPPSISPSSLSNLPFSSLPTSSLPHLPFPPLPTAPSFPSSSPSPFHGALSFSYTSEVPQWSSSPFQAQSSPYVPTYWASPPAQQSQYYPAPALPGLPGLPALPLPGHLPGLPLPGHLPALPLPTRNSSQVPNMPLNTPPLPLATSTRCTTPSGQVGVCSSAARCGAAGGELGGLCGEAPAAVCCTFRERCGATSDRQVTYFESPDHPSPLPGAHQCRLDLQLRPGVCQVRLDFLDVSLAPAAGGACSPRDRLALSSSHPQALLPVGEVCGTLAPSSHLYLHLGARHPERPDTTTPNSSPRHTVTLEAQTSGPGSRWRVRVTQVPCGEGDSLQAPPGCGQYYTEPRGNISSLNWPDGQYPRDLTLSSCIATDLAACGLAYTLHSMGLGRFGGNKLGYGLTCRDYIAIHGERTGMCGSVSTPRTLLLPPTSLGLTMHTDSQARDKEDVGFHLSYRFLHHCEGVRWHQPPSSPQ